ncbi:MAG TPA: hypothetical protein VFK44_04210 [Bacillales bacterium]|nr:hypothetical protein [Bacillales bacterium]
MKKDQAYRGEKYEMWSNHKAGETNVKATYEYTSGNPTAKSDSRKAERSRGGDRNHK